MCLSNLFNMGNVVCFQIISGKSSKVGSKDDKSRAHLVATPISGFRKHSPVPSQLLKEEDLETILDIRGN